MTGTLRGSIRIGAAAAACALAVVTSACGTTPPTRSTTPLAALGQPEGKVSILGWPGYVEDGGNDPAVNWVTPFEQQTGCKVEFKPFGTSDEAVTLMRSGQYDVVSASGDAALRLIGGGNVDPINTALVPNYADVFGYLKNKPWNSYEGLNYGVPHGWGANLLMYRTDAVTPAPTSWRSVFEDAAQYNGKVTAYDSPIYIADAALYLMAHRPDLKITNPYALDRTQFDAAVDLLKQQRKHVGEYWSDVTKEVQAFGSGSSVIGTTWQVGANLAQENKTPVNTVLPSEGATGWSDTWMVSSKSKHKTCAYKWLDYIVSPKVNAQVAEYFGEAPANSKACAETSDKDFCTTYRAEDEQFADRIWYWRTPIAACLDGRTDVTCIDYSAWTEAWIEIKG
ncbi:ABC transporter substrate-binding protein [Tsukamurella spumae]|uniref:ABC transporter substrate-binding protein n=1 Tax=Tsukamurella spumae TaxID=44753 RepID=A0A846X2P3_9ACTN|nr:ABC transporter substrate-binding protein [Tsukamurella spumae]